MAESIQASLNDRRLLNTRSLRTCLLVLLAGGVGWCARAVVSVEPPSELEAAARICEVFSGAEESLDDLRLQNTKDVLKQAALQFWFPRDAEAELDLGDWTLSLSTSINGTVLTRFDMWHDDENVIWYVSFRPDSWRAKIAQPLFACVSGSGETGERYRSRSIRQAVKGTK